MDAFERAAREAGTLAELNSLFGRAMRAFGFTAYAAGPIPCPDPPPAPGPLSPENSEPFLLIDWPRAWLELYARQGFAQDDAVIAAARTVADPFSWKELQDERPGVSARIFAAARSFGWHDGLVIPVPRAGGERDLISLAAPGLGHLGQGERERVVVLARGALNRAQDLAAARARLPTLTARERDALALVARGYDDAGIGVALGLTKATAHSYVERAKGRLGATTRAQAVALAFAHGVLETPAIG